MSAPYPFTGQHPWGAVLKAYIDEKTTAGELDPTIASLINDMSSDVRAALDALLAPDVVFYYPETYGAVGDGVTNDRAPIQAAIDAAKAAGGGTVLLKKGTLYGWSGILYVRNNVLLAGQTTRQVIGPTDDPSVSGLVALSASAQLYVGDWTTDAAPGGVSNLYVDGDSVGGLATAVPAGLVRIQGVDVQVSHLFCFRSAGDGVVYNGLQNSTVVGGSSVFHQGVAIAMDNGAGAVSFHGGYYGTSKGGALKLRNTAGESDLYPFGPTQNNWFGTIFESYDTLFSPHTSHVHITCGLNNAFYGCNFTAGAANDEDCAVLVDGSEGGFIATTVTFDNCVWWTRQDCDPVRVEGFGHRVFFANQQLLSDDGTNHAPSFVNVDGGIPKIVIEGEVLPAAGGLGDKVIRATNGGSLVQCFRYADTGTINRLTTETVVGFRHENDADHRMFIDRDGLLRWFDGAGLNDGILGRDTGGGVQVDGGLFSVKKGLSITGTQQSNNPAAIFGGAGTVYAIDPTVAKFHMFVYAGGGTDTFTFSNPVDGREIAVQLAIGANVPVITWPADVLWASGAAPTLLANTTPTWTFRYDATFTKWIEVSRAFSSSAAPARVTQYLTAQSLTAYPIPAGAKILRMRCSPGGGGGGSGARMGTGVLATGGGAGSAGYNEYDVAVAELTALGVSTLYVTVGAGGAGGAAVTVDSTVGNAGAGGGASMVLTSNGASTLANTLIYGAGANAGGGGTSAGAGAAGTNTASKVQTTGTASSATGLVGPSGGQTQNGGHGGAGAGGGITTANAQSAGGSGGYIAGKYTTTNPGGIAGGGNGNNADAPVVGNTRGASGGGSSLASAAGAGGNGLYGSGGAGGGASRNGFNSGKGGDGGTGFVEITAYF